MNLIRTLLSVCQYFCTVLNRARWLYATKGRWSYRSLMNFFKTGLAAVVSDCQKFFGFLPTAHQIAKFCQILIKIYDR